MIEAEALPVCRGRCSEQLGPCLLSFSSAVSACRHRQHIGVSALIDYEHRECEPNAESFVCECLSSNPSLSHTLPFQSSMCHRLQPNRCKWGDRVANVMPFVIVCSPIDAGAKIVLLM